MNIKDLIEVDPEKMSGTPCFTGTRVPVTHLFDYLEAGDTLNHFLTEFPSVNRAQALGVLELMKKRILTDEIEARWAAEAEQRINAVERGELHTVDGPCALSDLRSALLSK